MSTGFVCDDAHWPLLIVHYPSNPTKADYDAYLLQGEGFLERGEPYVTVFNMVKLSVPTAEQRRRQTDWMRERQRAFRELVIGCAFVIHSPVVRLSLSAMFHVMPLPNPYVAVSDVAAGVRWALKRLEEHGLHQAVERIRRSLPTQ